MHTYIHLSTRTYTPVGTNKLARMGWLRLVGSLKLQVSFAKEPYNRDDILQKRPIILMSVLIVAYPYDVDCDALQRIAAQCNTNAC